MRDPKQYTLEILDTLIGSLENRAKHKAPKQPEGAPPIAGTAGVLKIVQGARSSVAAAT